MASIVDLRSDTVSLPTALMRERMASAPVGDDVYGEDPTVLELEKYSANLFGKEAALFLPSGTMGNLLAVMVHCNRRGAEAIVGDLSHVFLYEQGNSAHLAGVQLSTIRNEEDGTFSLEQLRHKIRMEDCHEPITSLVVVEQTHNMCGGKVLPLEWLDALAKLVRQPGISPTRIALHMDGARVFNAAATLGVGVDRIARDFDSINFCLSKGLSAPVGSILVGTKEFITQAHRLRKALGGAMRQVGILAAAGLVALEEIVPLLPKDHERTKRIAKAVHDLQSPSVIVDLPNVQSNILLFQVKNPKLTASALADRLQRVEPSELSAGIHGANPNEGIVVKVSARDWQYARVVLYHQIDDTQVELAIKKLTFVIKEFDAQFK